MANAGQTEFRAPRRSTKAPIFPDRASLQFPTLVLDDLSIRYYWVTIIPHHRLGVPAAFSPEFQQPASRANPVKLAARPLHAKIFGGFDDPGTRRNNCCQLAY